MFPVVILKVQNILLKLNPKNKIISGVGNGKSLEIAPFPKKDTVHKKVCLFFSLQLFIKDGQKYYSHPHPKPTPFWCLNRCIKLGGYRWY